MKLEGAVRSSAKASIEDPQRVIKSLNPTVLSTAFGAAMSHPSNSALASFTAQLNQVLSQELGKSISLASPLSSGLVPFDLVAPSRLIYPVYSPLRNRLPRVAGQGTSRKVKVFTGVSGSHTGGTSIVDWSIGEFPGGGSFASWPNQLPGAGSQSAEDVSIPYKFFGLTEALSWLAQFSGQGFEDISSLANLILLQESMLAEEHMLLEGANTVIAAPGAATLTARTADSGETGLSGVTTNVYVEIVAKTFFGTTAAGTAASVAASNGQVVDVAIAPVAGAASYDIYVTTGAAPGTYHLAASGVGAQKFTLQGAIPTGTATPPVADTGTGASTRYDGIIPILAGHAASGTYPTDFTAGYINQKAGTQLTNALIADICAGLWDNSSALNTSTSGGYRADPAELIVEGFDASNFAQNVLSASSGGQQAYQLRIDQDEVGSVLAGAAISQVQNPLTRSVMRMVVHPYLQQGNLLAMTYQLPMSFANVSNAWEVTNVQDYLSISWPVVDVTFRYSLFLYGALVGIAPQYCGLVQGIQRSGSASGGNWS